MAVAAAIVLIASFAFGPTVQRKLLGKAPPGVADLRSIEQLHAVWLSFYPWDSRSDIDSTVLSDRRVTQLWDGTKVTGRWFADQVQGHVGIAWDIYFLYGSGARWDAAPLPLIGSGSPVIGNADQLRAQLFSQLRS